MAKVKNIIFDFGGVIINIDTNRLVQMLLAKGIDNIDQVHMHLVNNNIYNGLETGHVSPEQFRDAIRSHLKIPQTDKEIDDDWNAIILDIPAERVRLLENIKKHYSTYLLSNTNIIHYNYYNRYFAETYGYDNLSDLFKKAYFSHRMGLRKPDPAIYEMVLKDSDLIAGETLFIDDNEENVDAAKNFGIHAYHLNAGKELTDLFIDDRLAIDL